MSQQINLYQPIFRKEKRIFSAVTISYSLGMVLVALLTIYGFGRWQVVGLETEVVRLEGQERASLERLERLTRDFDRDAAGNSPAEELRQATDVLESRKRILQALAGGAVGGTGGFSEQLAAFARQRLDGLWLSRVILSGRGQQLRLEGHVTKPEFVPRYLQNLAEEPVFAGTGFTNFAIQRPADGRGPMEFLVSTSELAPDSPSQEQVHAAAR